MKRRTVNHSHLAVVLPVLSALAGCGGGGGSSTPGNQAPQATDDNALASVASSVIINVVANDTDSDGTIDPTTIAISTAPGNGSIVVNTNGTIRYTPNSAFVTGSDFFTYTVNDNNGASSNVARATITINQPPLAAGDCSVIRQENVFTGTLSATDTEDAPGSLTFSLASAPQPNLGQVSVNPDGSFSFDPNDNGPRGELTFTYRVQDSAGATDTATVTIIVTQKIMPLGDSITAGTSVGLQLSQRVGYRRKLYDDLLAAGYTVDLVGSHTDGQAAVPPIPDPNNEGHGGSNVMQITLGPAQQDANYPGIFGALTANPADIILLHIGTNGLTPGTTEDEVDTLLDTIQNWEDANYPVTVVVARIINQNPLNNDVPAYNGGLQTMVNNRINNQGDQLILVNMENALTYPGDLSDDRHPTQAGYDKMADVWFNAVTPLMDRCP